MNDYHSDIRLERIPKTELKEELKDNSKPDCIRFLDDIRGDDYWIHKTRKEYQSYLKKIFVLKLYMMSIVRCGVF